MRAQAEELREDKPDTKKSHLAVARICLVIFAGLATVFFIVWPVMDLTYRSEFSTPAFWWVLVLLALASWAITVIVWGLELLLAEISRLARKCDALEDLVATFGDEREMAGHATALRAQSNGHGTVRQLHPMD